MWKTRRLSLVGLTAGALVAALGLTFSANAAPGDGTANGADHGAKTGTCRNGYVGLTYDDGPSATLPDLLAALQANHLRATMFNMGVNAEAHPDLVTAEAAAGMWVGNHTYTHPHLPQLDANTSFEEIASTQWVLSGILHRTPTLFRPPYGETSDQVRAQEKSLNLVEVLWTVDSGDWNGATTDQIVAAASTLQPGGIILMHDWPANTITAVPRIAQMLKDRGLCAGRITYTPTDISGAGNTFHAIAVKP
ncbi:MAG: polysaccharide deacetylase family protein [Streptomyces sp.]|nr:polysaccharide deacetylase family protein [Streptomyces sp.]NUS11954.1 polysaccharide deacetylase family protein [Streptomyces sp.]